MKPTAVTLDQLQVFLSVVEAGSFSAAARSLGRAQSAVSYAIANLERLLEVQLFDRSGRKPVLTAEGQMLLEDARSVRHRVDVMETRAQRMKEGIEPQVSLAVDMLFPTQALLAMLAEFQQAWPQVGLLLRTEALGGVTQLVLEGGFRVGVSNANLVTFSEALVSEPLGTVELIPVASAEHPLARSTAPLSRASLDDHIQLVVTDRSPLTEGRDVGVVSSRTWRLAELGTKHQLLLGGFGWGSMPTHDVVEDIAAGRLVHLNLGGRETASDLVPLYSIHRRDVPPGPATRWLIERLRTAL